MLRGHLVSLSQVIAEPVRVRLQHGEGLDVCSCEASVRPGLKGTFTSCPPSFAAFSTAAHPPSTIKSASDTRFFPPGQIGQSIARRVGLGKHVVLADRSEANAKTADEVMGNAGYEVSVATVDVASREAVHTLVDKATGIAEITGLIQAAGVSPSQASPETILHVDLYGTAVVLEEFGNVIARGGSGVVIRFKRRLDASFFVGRQRGRLVIDGFNHVAAGRQVPEFWRKVFAIPGHEPCFPGHSSNSKAPSPTSR